ncbi:general substrate transporter [Tanacetum coccineum]
MPSYGCRWLLGLTAIPYLVALLFYGFVPESTRYLCTQGRLAEAQYILEKGDALNQKELLVGLLISDMTKEVPKNDQLPEITKLLPLRSNKTSNSQRRSTDTSDGLAAIQAQLNNLGREIKKVNEKVYAAQVGCEQCKGPHYTKDCPLKEEGKTLEEAYYT